MLCWQLDDLHLLNQLLTLVPMRNQRLNAADFEAMLLRESFQLWQARHAAVITHDFTNNTHRPAAGQLCQVDRCLRMTCALQYAARTSAQREDMPGLCKIIRGGCGVSHHLNGCGTIPGADSGGYPVRRIHANLKIRVKCLLIPGHHSFYAQLPQAIFSGRHTNQTATMFGHKIDRLGRRVFCGHDEIPLILPIFIVNHDDHSATPNICNCRLN